MTHLTTYRERTVTTYGDLRVGDRVRAGAVGLGTIKKVVPRAGRVLVLVGKPGWRAGRVSADAPDAQIAVLRASSYIRFVTDDGAVQVLDMAAEGSEFDVETQDVDDDKGNVARKVVLTGTPRVHAALQDLHPPDPVPRASVTPRTRGLVRGPPRGHRLRVHGRGPRRRVRPAGRHPLRRLRRAPRGRTVTRRLLAVAVAAATLALTGCGVGEDVVSTVFGTPTPSPTVTTPPNPKTEWVKVAETRWYVDVLKRCDGTTLLYVTEPQSGSSGGSSVSAVPNSPECQP